MINLYYDNIVFSLQKAGGISVVWYELLKRVLKDNQIDCTVIERPSDLTNIYRKLLEIPPNNSIKDENILPYSFSRFINPLVRDVNELSIFHSSYYRVSSNKLLRSVTTVHDFTYEYFRNGLAQKCHSFQKHNAVIKSDGVICVSQNTKKDLLKFYPKVSEDKIAVIYNGVDEGYRFLTDCAPVRDYLPFEEKSYLLYVGDRKSKYKNFLHVVESAIKTKLPLVLVGAQPQEDEVAFLNNSVGKNNYICLSHLNIDELNLIYNAAFCLIYPSAYEGFGIPILEAQRAGCPVICVNTSSIPEVAVDSTVLLDNSSADGISDAVLELINGRIETKEIIRRGFENSKRFSWDKCYAETKQFYQKTLI